MFEFNDKDTDELFGPRKKPEPRKTEPKAEKKEAKKAKKNVGDEGFDVLWNSHPMRQKG